MILWFWLYTEAGKHSKPKSVMVAVSELGQKPAMWLSCMFTGLGYKIQHVFMISHCLADRYKV